MDKAPSEETAKSADGGPGKEEGAPPSKPSVKRVLFFVLSGAVLQLLATWVGTSVVLGQLDVTSQSTALYIALAVVLTLTLVLPSALAIKFARTVRIATRTFAGWNLVLVMAMLLLLTGVSKRSLWDHGDWPARLVGQDEAEQMQQPLRAWLARLPGETPEPEKVAAANSQPASAPATQQKEEDPGPYNAEQVFSKSVPSVVHIGVRKPLDDGWQSTVAKSLGIQEQESHGSGFVVSRDGLIVTNHHVIGDAISAHVRLRDGRVFPDVTILVTLQTHDLALIQVDHNDLTPLQLTTTEITTGTEAFALGNPMGLDFSLTNGIVSGSRDWQGTHMLQMQTDIAPGSSGGPVVNNMARLMGVSTASKGPGLNLAVHVKHVHELLEKPRKAQRLQRWQQRMSLASLEVDGQALPTTRAQIETMASFMAQTVGQCLQGEPEGGHRILVEVERKTRGGHLITSNLGKGELRCSQKSIDMLAWIVPLQFRDKKKLVGITYRFSAPVQNPATEGAQVPVASPTSGHGEAATAAVEHVAKQSDKPRLVFEIAFVDKLTKVEKRQEDEIKQLKKRLKELQKAKKKKPNRGTKKKARDRHLSL